MTPDTPDTPDTPRRAERERDTRTQPMLDQAKVGLRQQADDRWVEISDRVLAKALTTTRRSHPIRAQASSGPVQISEQVLISCLREAIDGTVAGSALAHVTLQVEGKDDLVGVTIQLIAEYGAELLPIADEVRRLASECLGTILGPVPLPVTINTLHVHFADVVVGDPHASPG